MKQGSREAFDEIYNRYWLKLFVVAGKRIRSKDDAKDLVQDLFFSLWMKRERLMVDTSLSSYLFSAIKYKVINYVESNVVKGDYLKSLDKALVDYDNSTDEAILSRDLEQFINLEIDNLSPKVREIFELSRRQNFSVKEIAEKLNLSDQTVKNQISKALKILRLHVSDSSFLLLLFMMLSYSIT